LALALQGLNSIRERDLLIEASPPLLNRTTWEEDGFLAFVE